MINDSDRVFRASIESCSWADPFSHEDHIRLGWIYLQEFGTAEAIARCGKALRKLAESHGDFGKYHETLTVAMMHLIAGHVRETPETEDWASFRARVRPIFESARELIGRHYSAERLARPDARQTFLPPDLKPL